QGDEIAAATGFDLEDVVKSVDALDESNEHFFDLESTYGNTRLIMKPSGAARRAVGYWPTPDSLADRFIQRLDDMADDVQDIEKRSKLKELGRWASAGGRELIVQVMAETLKRSMS